MGTVTTPTVPYRIRKPNRVSRPARATQDGTSTSYPHPDYARLARLRSRWADTGKDRD